MANTQTVSNEGSRVTYPDASNPTVQLHVLCPNCRESAREEFDLNKVGLSEVYPHKLSQISGPHNLVSSMQSEHGECHLCTLNGFGEVVSIPGKFLRSCRESISQFYKMTQSNLSIENSQHCHPQESGRI